MAALCMGLLGCRSAKDFEIVSQQSSSDHQSISKGMETKAQTVAITNETDDFFENPEEVSTSTVKETDEGVQKNTRSGRSVIGWSCWDDGVVVPLTMENGEESFSEE